MPVIFNVENTAKIFKISRPVRIPTSILAIIVTVGFTVNLSVQILLRLDMPSTCHPEKAIS